MPSSGRLCGILTNRDMRFERSDDSATAASLMTKRQPDHGARGGLAGRRRRTCFGGNKIERLIVVDDDHRAVGLITVKDMEKAEAHPHAAKDSKGRLLVGAASTVGDAGFERSLALIDAGVDVVVIDTAHGHSRQVSDAVRRLSRESNRVQIVAGNVATYDGAKALDRRGRRRGEGRHRTGLDLHHADRRGRRRAAVHRHRRSRCARRRDPACR